MMKKKSLIKITPLCAFRVKAGAGNEQDDPTVFTIVTISNLLGFRK